MAASKTLTMRFVADDQVSPALQRMTAGITGMVAQVERMSGAGLASGVEAAAAQVENAVQRVGAAVNAFADGQSRISEACSASREQMVSMAEAAYQAAGASEEVTEAAVSLAESTADLSESMEEAQQTQEELTAALEDAQSVMDDLSKAENVSAEAKERLAEAMEEAQRAQEELTAAQEEATRAQEEALRIMQSGTATLEEIEAASKRVADAQERLSEAEEEAARATEELQDATDEARDGMENLADSSKKTTSIFGDMFKKIEAIGSKFAKGDIIGGLRDIGEIAQEVAEYIMDCVEAFAEFEEGLAKVSTIADTSRKSMASIRSDLMQLSRDTGTSVNELLDAEYQALSASVDTAESTAFVATANQLAVAGFTSTADSVDILTTALNAYGLEASEATHVSDVLIQTQNLGKTTIGELSANMGRAIPVAQAFNVDLENLSASYVELTKRGINTAEATTRISGMIKELGDTGSQVAQILVSQTGQSFSQLMANGASLGDVLQILGDAVQGNTDAFYGLWGSAEAASAASTLFEAGAANFNSTLNELQGSAGATQAAFETMENTTADALEDFGNAMQNFMISIGEFFAPIVTPILQAITAIVDVVSKAISGLAQVVTAVLGPVFQWIGDGISWVCDAISGWMDSLKTETDEYRKATPIAKDYADTLGSLEDKYAALVDSVGEEAAAQSDLAAQIEEARAEYELMYETMDEYMARTNAAAEAAGKLGVEIDDTIHSMQTAPKATKLYIDRIAELAGKTNRSASETKLLEGMIGRLNDDYSGLNATIEDFTGATGRGTDAIRQQIETMQNTAAMENYSRLYGEVTTQLCDAEVELAMAQEMLDSAQERFNNAEWWEQLGWFGSTVKSDLDDATEAVETWGGTVDTLTNKMGLLQQFMGDMGDAASEAGDKAFEALSQTEQGEVAAAAVFQSVTGSIEEIIAAYDDAYAAAESSIRGQISLFNEFQANSEISIGNMIDNLRSQNDAMEGWAENLANTRAYLESTERYSGDQINTLMGMVSELNEDTAGAAAELSGLATAAANGNVDAQRQLDELMTEIDRAETNAETLPDSVANSVSGAETALDGLELYAHSVIEGLNLEPEAQAAAMQTIGAWIGEIQAQAGPMKTEAYNAANGAASDIISEFGRAASEVGDYCNQMTSKINELPTSKTFTYYLKTSGSLPDMSGIKGNAQGTRFSSDVYIAGEEGPELIVGARGSRVYTARETREIMDALRDTHDATDLASVATPEIGALEDMTALAEQMAEMQQQPAAEAQSAVSDAAVGAIEAATRAIDGLTETQGGLQRSIDAQQAPMIEVQKQPAQPERIAFMDPMGTGMATNNLPTSAEFSEAFNLRSAGLMGWIADKLNERTGIDDWTQNRSLAIADLLGQKIGADSEGSFTYRRSPDYNPFSEFNLEDQFRGVSSGLSEWIVDKLSSRNITDMTVQQNSQTVIDWLTRRLDLDPSGTIGAGSFDVSFPEIMLPDSGASLDVPLPTVMMPSSDRLPEAPAARPAASFMMPNGSTDSEPRTLEINVNGQGAIKVDGAISADRAAEIASQQIADQAKDVLLGIIKQEMTEEGDRSYVY